MVCINHCTVLYHLLNIFFNLRYMIVKGIVILWTANFCCHIITYVLDCDLKATYFRIKKHTEQLTYFRIAFMISFIDLLKISVALIWEPSWVHAHQFLFKLELTITFIYRSNENIACVFWRWDWNSWATMNEAIETMINMHSFPTF